MAAIGGSIESVTLDGRTFSVTADADVNRKLGGFENAVEANGDGTVRILKTRVPGLLDGLVVSIDDSRADLEYLQELADRTDVFPVTCTMASSITYQADMQVSGEISSSTANATASFALSGGQLTAQE